jgi:tetratricopeptide (TPR) repeat protein
MLNRPILVLAIAIFSSCHNKTKNTTAISLPDLKRGELVSCSPADGKIFGSVSFDATVPEKLRADFNTAVALLHSFEYDESEKMFAKVIDQEPDCAMAYWGVAMSNFHPLWAPPTPSELEKGMKSIRIAKGIKNKTKRESDFIDAMEKFFENSDKLDHRTRVLNYEKAMETLHQNYPDDTEVTVFYALALNSAADPTDKTYARQKKAFSLLNPVYQKQPLHPGLAHYIIHNSDYPALAEQALPAARKYASIAPASSHAQHMPSHIFTRLGLWNDCIESNLAAKASAICYAEQTNIKGHWDEELHTIDYLMYAYLQKADDEKAKNELDYLRSIKHVEPINFKVAYPFAAVPARYALERKMWKEASEIEPHLAGFPWEKYQWQKAIIHFARALGSVNTGNLDKANIELATLKDLHASLQKQKEKAKEASQVAVQVEAIEAWIQFKKGNNETALQRMTKAADMEDGMEKHPVTPGEVIPARELLGEMLLQMNKPAEALAAFDATLKNHANRFNALYGAGIAARKAGDKTRSNEYFATLLNMVSKNSQRKEVAEVRAATVDRDR